jgi:hypothetical protein
MLEAVQTEHGARQGSIELADELVWKLALPRTICERLLPTALGDTSAKGARRRR